jgi:hypothetical protein
MTPTEQALFQRWVAAIPALEQAARDAYALAYENALVNGPSNSAATMGTQAEIAEALAAGLGSALPTAFSEPRLVEVPLELRRRACGLRGHYFPHGGRKCVRCGRSEWPADE